MGIFDNVRTYITIDVDTPTPVMFEDDEPFRDNIDSFGNEQHLFNVNGSNILSINSMPLLRALKPYAPLGGKTLVITRTGRGYSTRYNVEVMS